MFISWWKDKQKVVSWYNGILWNIPQPQKGMEHRCMLQHGWNLKTLCQREEARQERPHTVWLHLRGMSRAGRSIDRKETVFARGWREEGMGGWLLNEYRASFWGNGKFWNRAVVMTAQQWRCTQCHWVVLENGSHGEFYVMCISLQLKTKQCLAYIKNSVIFILHPYSSPGVSVFLCSYSQGERDTMIYEMALSSGILQPSWGCPPCIRETFPWASVPAFPLPGLRGAQGPSGDWSSGARQHTHTPSRVPARPLTAGAPRGSCWPEHTSWPRGWAAEPRNERATWRHWPSQGASGGAPVAASPTPSQISWALGTHLPKGSSHPARHTLFKILNHAFIGQAIISAPKTPHCESVDGSPGRGGLAFSPST